MKQVVILLLFTLFTTNVFANTALNQINNILTDRISVKEAEANGGIEGINEAEETQEISGRIELEAEDNSNIGSTRKIKGMLGESYEFIFFYRSSCPYCRKFEPILKQYSIDAAIPVKAFTFDGVVLPSFPNSVVVDKTVISEYFSFFSSFNEGTTIAVPALFIMNTANLHVFPVSSGELSYMDLVVRMNDLIPKILSIEGRARV